MRCGGDGALAVGPYLIYDGDCGFCRACARFVERHVPTPAQVRPWQSVDVAALGLTVAACTEAAQWVAVNELDRRVTASGPAAIAELLKSSSPAWRLVGRLLSSRGALAVGWPVYRWIARNRHRLPGGSAMCALPARSAATALDRPERLITFSN